MPLTLHTTKVTHKLVRFPSIHLSVGGLACHPAMEYMNFGNNEFRARITPITCTTRLNSNSHNHSSTHWFNFAITDNSMMLMP